jgi:hypothetical protein
VLRKLRRKRKKKKAKLFKLSFSKELKEELRNLSATN